MGKTRGNIFTEYHEGARPMRRAGIQTECEDILKNLRKKFEKAVAKLQPGEEKNGAEVLLTMFLDLEDEGMKCFQGSYSFMRDSASMPWED
jgi:hypothetical protein